MSEELSELASINLHHTTDAELARFRSLPDDDLLRASGSLDAFAIVESSRRLKIALHGEELAIKRLTKILVILTVILVILTCTLVVLGIEPLWRK